MSCNQVMWLQYSTLQFTTFLYTTVGSTRAVIVLIVWHYSILNIVNVCLFGTFIYHVPHNSPVTLLAGWANEFSARPIISLLSVQKHLVLLISGRLHIWLLRSFYAPGVWCPFHWSQISLAAQSSNMAIMSSPKSINRESLFIIKGLVPSQN